MKALKVILVILSIIFVSAVSAQDVYTTKTGEKYHKNTCRYLKDSKYKVDLKKVIELGYEACKVCKPPSSVSKLTSNSSSLATRNNKTTSSKKYIATQCTGKTKAGQRCKRMTKNANGRCYQH